MVKKSKGAAKAAPTIRIARLDSAGVLQSFDTIAQGSVAALHNGMPEWVDGGDCDLKPGRYRWSPQAGKFDLIKVAKVDVEMAMIEGFRHLRDVHGLDLAPVTESWIAEYDKRKERAGA